jgi:hypothetical protein
MQLHACNIAEAHVQVLSALSDAQHACVAVPQRASSAGVCWEAGGGWLWCLGEVCCLQQAAIAVHRAHAAVRQPAVAVGW